MSLSVNNEVSSQSLCDAQTQLLYSGKFTDATVKCEEVEWKVHRSILCTRSAYFEACLGGNFQENSSGLVEFKDQKPYAVEGFLVYLYTLDYPKSSSSEYFLLQQPEQISKLGLKATKKKEANSRETRLDIQRKSQPPEYPWQECMALCRIGEYCGAGRLRDMAAAETRRATEKGLKSSVAMEFLADHWMLPDAECLHMVPDAITIAARDVKKLTKSPLFGDFVAAHPSVACDLIKAVGEELEAMTNGGCRGQW